MLLRDLGVPPAEPAKDLAGKKPAVEPQLPNREPEFEPVYFPTLRREVAPAPRQVTAGE